MKVGNATCFAALVWLASCLPEGEAGIGEHLVAQRGLAEPAFIDTGFPGPGLFYSRRVLKPSAPVMPEGAGAPTRISPSDLFFMASGAAPQRLIEDNVPPARWDAAGRLYLQRDERSDVRSVPGWSNSRELWRFEGEQPAGVELGRVASIAISPGGTRLLIVKSDGQPVLRDLADREMVLPGIQALTLVGEDVIYIQDGSLMRVSDTTTPASTLVDGDVIRWSLLGSGNGRLVLWVISESEHKVVVFRSGASGPAKIVQFQRPVASPLLAPDGRRLALVERVTSEAGRIRLLDLESGSETEVAIALPPPADSRSPPRPGPGPLPPEEPAPPRVPVPAEREYFGELEFRPASEELWWFLDDRLTIFGSDGQVRSYPKGSSENPAFSHTKIVSRELFNWPYQSPYDSVSRFQRESRFTSDGRFWTSVDGEMRSYLADAVDPGSGVSILLNQGSSLVDDLHEVVVGHWLAFLEYRQNSGDPDLYIVDLDQPTPRLLARNVIGAQFGRTRAVLRVRGLTSGEYAAPADLVLVDLASGVETLLAQNVTSFALPPACPECDPLQPGTQLVYVVQARVPWKYDGLWSGSLP